MKQRIQIWSNKLFKPVKSIPAGIYHYQSPADMIPPYRMHLRIDPDGEGLLVVNASTVLHMNQTAAEYSYYFIQGKQPSEVGRLIQSRYKIKAEQASHDFQNIALQIQTLVTTPDLAPELFIDLERVDPYSGDISAPYRLDCALTYKSISDLFHGKLVKRVDRELTTDEWKIILEKTADAGIPHVIFTGGEATIRPDLAELIAHTEKLELVCGLITDGSRLTDPAYLHSLLNSGLDHLMLLLDDSDSGSWEALKDSLAEDIYLTVHITLNQKNTESIRDIVDKLSTLCVPSISLSMESDELSALLSSTQQYIQQKGIKLVWDLPVPYSASHPIALELAEHKEYSSGAGKAWLYIEPDGGVLPDQDDNRKLGNLLTDPWEAIWKQR
jgi:organic radical activating enzyme